MDAGERHFINAIIIVREEVDYHFWYLEWEILDLRIEMSFFGVFLALCIFYLPYLIILPYSASS